MINGLRKRWELENKFAGPWFFNAQIPYEENKTIPTKLWRLLDSQWISKVGQNFKILVIFCRINYKMLLLGTITFSSSMRHPDTQGVFKLYFLQMIKTFSNYFFNFLMVMSYLHQSLLSNIIVFGLIWTNLHIPVLQWSYHMK